MKVTYPIPDQKISQYVQGILVIENYQDSSSFILPLFANGTPTLLFQTQKGQVRNLSNYLTLFGQTVSPEKMFIKDKFTLIAYFLKPISLISLFGITGQELRDNPIDFNLLSKNSGLQEQLLNATTTSQMLTLLNDYILGLILKTNPGDWRIKYATEKILLNSCKNILVTIQNELGLTERSFQRMFERNIGVSPGQFRRISQFNKAFRQLNKRQFQTLSDIAFDNDYSDQSHFIRSFKEYTKLTPTEYLNLSSLS